MCAKCYTKLQSKSNRVLINHVKYIHNYNSRIIVKFTPSLLYEAAHYFIKGFLREILNLTQPWIKDIIWNTLTFEILTMITLRCKLDYEINVSLYTTFCV